MKCLAWWRWLVSLGCHEFFLNMCRYARPFAKLTVLMTNAAWLAPMSKRCRCTGPHAVRLQGSVTTAASSYSNVFTSEAVAHMWQHRGERSGPNRGEGAENTGGQSVEQEEPSTTASGSLKKLRSTPCGRPRSARAWNGR